jgi:hypothetical protein
MERRKVQLSTPYCMKSDCALRRNFSFDGYRNYVNTVTWLFLNPMHIDFINPKCLLCVRNSICFLEVAPMQKLQCFKL